MRLQVKQVNRFFLLTTGPFFGLLLFMFLSSKAVSLDVDVTSHVPAQTLEAQAAAITEQLTQSEELVNITLSSIQESSDLYIKTTNTMTNIVQNARTQAAAPERIYNRRISSKLGAPYNVVNSDRIRIELYKVNPGSYRGYAMKIKLKDPTAMKMSLSDSKSGAETTLHAVNRYGAVAGINAGGFADANGKRYPLSTTVVNGKYITGFQASFKDLFFVGMNASGKLIGGKFHSKSELDKLEPVFGATFVPVLLQNGRKATIPDKWKTSPKRAPRTVIGNYKDDQLLIIVVDGYNENGSSGATLQELQNKMYALGVQNAYNLDGGGSSSLVLNGRVVNKPSDGSLRPVPTNFLFFK